MHSVTVGFESWTFYVMTSKQHVCTQNLGYDKYVNILLSIVSVWHNEFKFPRHIRGVGSTSYVAFTTDTETGPGNWGAETSCWWKNEITDAQNQLWTAEGRTQKVASYFLTIWLLFTSQCYKSKMTGAWIVIIFWQIIQC